MDESLSTTDKKLLFALDFAARKPTAELARTLHLSKQGTDYKIKTLENKGILTGYYPIVNLTKLGYVYGRIWLKFQNLTQQKEQELYEKFRKNPNFSWIIVGQGKYDMGIAVWASTLTEFKVVSENLLARYGKYIKEKRESIATRLTQFPVRYLLDNSASKEVIIEEEPETVQLDALDKKILNALCKNARTSLIDIAKVLRTSSKVVAYRIKRMEANKILKGYRPIIDNNKLGFTHYKLFFYLTNVTPSALQDFKNYLRNNSNVIYIVEELGICDLDTELMFQSSQDLFAFLRELKFKFPTLIKEYDTMLISDTLKIEYLP